MTPTIYIRVTDGVLLNDLQGNGTGSPTGVSTNNPPIGTIPILFSPVGGANGDTNNAGFRVPIFDGNDSQNPVGFATPVAGSPGLYQYTFTTPLADGIHNINAAVEMVDPAKAQQTGFGAFSIAPIQLTIDTVPPPTFFGTNANGDNGLAANSDSGVPIDQPTLTDDVTNVTDPTFFGVAEANAVIKVYAAINNPTNPNFSAAPVFPTNFVLIGQTVATPFDGTNADPNGIWSVQSNLNMNDSQFFMLDGLRTIAVTGEDLAGNVSTPSVPLSILQIFVDTQGPNVTNVQVTGVPAYNLFAQKGTTPNFSQGPTPLVHSLTITVQDLPNRVDPFLSYAALDTIADANPGLYSLVGDQVGIVPITSVAIDNMTPATPNTPAMSTITLTFSAQLPQEYRRWPGHAARRPLYADAQRPSPRSGWQRPGR